MDDVAMARINLCALLRTLEQLPPLDAEAARICTGVDETIQFFVPLPQPDGTAADPASTSPAPKRNLLASAKPASTVVRLRLSDAQVSHHFGPGPSSIKLFFPSAKAVNAMFSGTGNPIPTKGFRKIGFLTGPFTKLTDRLEHYLRPTDELLADPDYARTNAVLTLHVAAYAIAEIGNYDPAGRLNAQRMADGDIVLAVKGDQSYAITLRARGGRLKVLPGPSPAWRAKMVFSDIDVAGQVLRGELASYTAIGREQLALGGYIPNLDHMNKILGLVPRYLG